MPEEKGMPPAVEGPEVPQNPIGRLVSGCCASENQAQSKLLRGLFRRLQGNYTIYINMPKETYLRSR